jgi:hypothetical protein
MKVLFLDPDGVLNPHPCFREGCEGPPLSPDAVRRLHRVVRETECRVVLSAAWRTMQRRVDKLIDEGGFPRPHKDWRTPVLPDPREPRSLRTLRGHEIAEWLSRHSEVERYAILGDNADLLPDQTLFFVRTELDRGLLDDDASKLVEILNKGMQP